MLMVRKGLGKGKGKGYKNIVGKDPKIHSDSSKGRKRPQRIINIQRVVYGSPKTPVEQREYQMGRGLPVGTIKEFEDYFKDQNVKLNVAMTLKEKMEVTRKSNLKDSDGDGVGDVLDCEPNDPTKQDFQAEVILQQLGGNKFRAMTGAKNFTKNDKEQSISFKIPKAKDGINLVTIKLNSRDTYDMEFYSVRNYKGKYSIKIKAEYNGVYNDQLQELFTKATGLYTSL